MSSTQVKVEIPKGWTVEFAHGAIIYGLEYGRPGVPRFVPVEDISPEMQEMHETATLVTIAPTLLTRIKNRKAKTRGTLIKWDDYTNGPEASVVPVQDQLQTLIMAAVDGLEDIAGSL